MGINEESDKYTISGKELERYFNFNDALLEFHRLFKIELLHENPKYKFLIIDDARKL